MAYAPCIDWGMKDGDTMRIQQLAVDSGYWPLFRYDPTRQDKKFQLDSKKIKINLKEFTNA